MLINYKISLKKRQVNYSINNGGTYPRQRKLKYRSKYFIFLLLLTFSCIDNTFAKSTDYANAFPDYLIDTNTTRAKNDINQAIINSDVITGDLLVNDTDQEGDLQSVESATYTNSAGATMPLPFLTTTDIYDETGEFAGAIRLKSSGTYTFNPVENYTGTVTIGYVVIDDNIDPATDMGMLSIRMLSYPSVTGEDYPTIPQDDTNTVEQGKTVTSYIRGNDIDPDGNTSTAFTATASNGWGGLVTLTTTAEDIYDANTELAGNAKLDADGNIEFEAEVSYVGKVDISYSYTTATAKKAVLTITVEPSWTNGSLGAANDSYANDDANTGLTEAILTGNVLTNDYDPEGNNQTVTAASNFGIEIPIGEMTAIEAVGEILLTANGDYTFMPYPSFSGTEKVEYTVCDDGAMQICERATLYLTILPTNSTVAKNDIHQVAINTLARGFLLNNDRDVQGDSINVQSASRLDATGQPKPLALGVETQLFNEDGVLTGTIILMANGNYIFDPEPEYTGKVPVSYVLEDDNRNKATDSGTLRIYIMGNPFEPGFNNNVIAQDDTNTLETGEEVECNILSNDRDLDDDMITIISATVSNGAGGSTTLNQSDQNFYDANNIFAGTGSIKTGGEVVFKASDTFVGDVIVNYTVSDGSGSTDDAILTITVESFKTTDNDSYANDDANVGLQDVTLTGNVQVNDYDPDGVDQDISLIDTDGDGIPETQPLVELLFYITVEGEVVGTFSMDTKVGGYVWDPEPDFLGTVTVPYLVTDGTSYSTATLYLTNLPFNSTEVKDDINNTPFNTAVVGDISTNDVDQEGDERGYYLENANGGMNSDEGTIELLANGSYTFTPASGFSGYTAFRYEVCDNGYPVRCKMATVHIEVLPELDVHIQPIIANVDANTTKRSKPTSGNIISNDVDLEGRSLKVTTATPGTLVSGINIKGEAVSAAGKMSMDEQGKYNFVSIGDFIGRIEYPYTTCVTDDLTICDDGILIIDVLLDEGNTTYANDAATITEMGIVTTGRLLTNDEDTESDAQAVTTFHYDSDGSGKADTEGGLGTDIIVGGYDTEGIFTPNSGTFNVNAAGEYTFTPAMDFAGNAVLPYTICDNNGTIACSRASLVITVLKANKDWSDAPAAYAPAWHRALLDNNDDNVLDGADNVWLGSKANFETADLASADAANDDFDDAINFGTADGEFPVLMLPLEDYEIDMKLNSQTAALVYYGMWIDWNNDGTYEDFYNGSSNITGETTIGVTVTAPSFIGAILNVRLRVDDNEFLEADYAGGRTNGEVEDYQNLVELPVEMLYFEGSSDRCSNELSWATASEKNNSHFVIEHSSDGESFEEIGRVDGNGDSVDKIEYDYTHEGITTEENYYRLMQVDYDGASAYSDIIILKSSCAELVSGKILIYPNPSKGLVTIEISNESGMKRDIEIRVTDVLGRILISRNTTVQHGVNNENVDLTPYPKGTYMITIIRNGNEVETYPVSLIKG